MQKLLIAMTSEEARSSLTELLRRRYDITVCGDGATAADLLFDLRPDALIMDLMLPVKDGFFVLEETADCRPPVVICVTDFINDYMTQTARDLQVSYLIRKPCQPRVIVSRLEHLIRHIPSPTCTDGQSQASQLLLQFRFNPKNDGFRFLKIGIPLYAQDPHQRICKELYASIAQISGAGTWNQVERSIRSAIETAWRTRSDMWERYFPSATEPPTGKTFISRIAQILIDAEQDPLKKD